MHVQFTPTALVGPCGKLAIRNDDPITRKLAMLFDGECTELGPLAAARKYGFTKQRYFQLRHTFCEQGAIGLQNHKRGPKRPSRRTDAIVCQVLRHRFLDPDASAKVIAQKLCQARHPISISSVERVFRRYGLQKKLYVPPTPPPRIETQCTKQHPASYLADPISLERGWRQNVADKVSGTCVGLWLLIPEHLRLGTWDLLCGWTHQTPERVEPRLAMQLVHEAALCVHGLREKRCLSHKGFETLNGLPFVASDLAVHNLLNDHTVAEAEDLQCNLGRIRHRLGHFQGRNIAIDPHRVRSYSQRQMPHRCPHPEDPAVKTAQTFFSLDADTAQPICFTTGTAARTVAQATPPLLNLTQRILLPRPHQILALADSEHFAVEGMDSVRENTPFDLLVPMPNYRSYLQRILQIPDRQFTRHWAGMATASLPFLFSHNASTRPWRQIVQRGGEKSFSFKAFLTSSRRHTIPLLCSEYPKRWHIEEFFQTYQALGWNRAGTLNLHIRYAQMTMALIAQAASHQLRQRLGVPFQSWSASHLGRDLLQGLDGDIRVHDDTVVVTFYNPPNVERLRAAYEHLPDKLVSQNIDPRVPWLYGFKLDFRFR